MSSRVVDIKEYWSPVVGESLEFTAIADAENPEFNYLWEKIYGLVDEFFVKSATEYGVSRMEKILNIAPQKGESLQSRKDRLIWKMNLRIPYTMRFLKNILASVVGEENREVEFDNDIQTLTVRIKEGLWDISQLRTDLEKIIPADLVLRIGGEFKKDAFKVVGNPTITSDGIFVLDGVSNRQNYVEKDLSFIANTTSFQIELPIKIEQLPTTVDASIGMLSDVTIGQFCNINIITNGEIKLLLRDGTSQTYWNILNGALIPRDVVKNNLGKDFICVIKYSNGIFERGYKLDGNYYSVGTVNYTLTNALNFTKFMIGWNTVNAPSYAGSIDLKQFSITADTHRLINHYEVVGSPTIVDGVASGFIVNDYIRVPKGIFPASLNSMVIMGEFVTTSLTQKNQAILGGYQIGGTGETPPAFLDVRLTSTGGQFIYSSGNGTQSINTFAKTIKVDTKYSFKVEIIGSNIKFYLNNEIVFTGNTFLYVQPENFNIGVNRVSKDYFLGSIDLKQFSITVDGGVVYRAVDVIPRRINFSGAW